MSAIGVTATVFWSARIARRRATLDLLLNEQTNETAVSERTRFIDLKKKGDLGPWATTQNENAPELEALRATLNRYELVAIGIKDGIIDGNLYKRYCRTTFVKDWLAVKPFVVQLRATHKVPTFYSDLEALAKAWANKEEKPHV